MDPSRVSALEIDDEGSARFEAFYGAHRQPIAAYVRRRVIEHDVEDVIAQVFLIAWRRFALIPPPPEDRLWLFGVARRMVADHRRSTMRRRRLSERLAEEARGPVGPVGTFESTQLRVDRAMQALPGSCQQFSGGFTLGWRRSRSLVHCASTGMWSGADKEPIVTPAPRAR